MKPHIIVDQEKAYDLAYEKARSAAKEFKEKQMALAKQKARGMSDALSEAEGYYQQNQLEKGRKILFSALARGLDNHVLNEGLINRLGYNFMGQGKIDLAIGLFTFNVQSFPQSGNAFDSLGEAYGEKGDFQSAIENYRKSHELDGNNQNALKMIEKFKNKLAGKKQSKHAT